MKGLQGDYAIPNNVSALRTQSTIGYQGKAAYSGNRRKVGQDNLFHFFYQIDVQHTSHQKQVLKKILSEKQPTLSTYNEQKGGRNLILLVQHH